MHLADAFIQSDLQCIQAIHVFFFFVMYVTNFIATLLQNAKIGTVLERNGLSFFLPFHGV